jgi:hypothetical protein
MFGSRYQSYDRELQRQRCKNLQRHEWPSAFCQQTFYSILKYLFFPNWHPPPICQNAGVQTQRAKLHSNNSSGEKKQNPPVAHFLFGLARV